MPGSITKQHTNHKCTELLHWNLPRHTLGSNTTRSRSGPLPRHTVGINTRRLTKFKCSKLLPRRAVGCPLLIPRGYVPESASFLADCFSPSGKAWAIACDQKEGHRTQPTAASRSENVFPSAQVLPLIVCRLEKRAFDLTNEFRRTAKLQALIVRFSLCLVRLAQVAQWDDSLHKIGSNHSSAMAEKRSPFGHDKFAERNQQFIEACPKFVASLYVSTPDTQVLRLHSAQRTLPSTRASEMRPRQL